MATREFFETLEARAEPAKIAGVSNSYLFDIEGEGQWLVDVRDGAVTVTEGGGDADATISTSSETFDEDRRGRAEPDDGVHDREAEDQGRHGRRHEAPEALLASLRARRARRRPRPGRPRARAPRAPSRRRARRARSPSSSPRARRAGGATRPCRPRATSTLITVPGIGAVTRLDCVRRPALRGARRADVGRRRGRRRGQVQPERPAPRRGRRRRAAGARAAGARRGTRSSSRPRAKLGVRDEPAQERQVRRHALDHGLGERGGEPVERLVARRAVRDQLREQRVVGGADLVALVDARVDADARGQPQPRRCARPAAGTCAGPPRRAAPRRRGRAARDGTSSGSPARDAQLPLRRGRGRSPPR